MSFTYNLILIGNVSVLAITISPHEKVSPIQCAYRSDRKHGVVRNTYALCRRQHLRIVSSPTLTHCVVANTYALCRRQHLRMVLSATLCEIGRAHV